MGEDGSSPFGWQEACALLVGLGLLSAAALALGVRAALIAGIGALCLFSFFYKLGVATWNPDERIYSEAGLAYLRDGNFSVNLEHPPLAKYLLGLAQLIGGEREILAVRLVAAIATAVTGALLFLLGRRAVGVVAGMIAVVMWAALPSAFVIAGEVVSPGAIGRYAILETVMVAFVAAALYCGWRWAESCDKRWALATGLAVGLAGACKLPGLLVAVPILALVAYRQPISRHVAVQALAFMGAGVAAIIAAYLPMGTDGFDLATDMLDFQGEHARAGHLITVGDRVYAHPPWWANGYFQWHSMGGVAMVTLGALAVASFFVVPRALALYLSIAVLTPFLYLSVVAPIALPHYFYLWLAPLVLLTGAALHGLIASAQPIRRGAGVAAAVALAVVAGQHLVDVATVERSDYARAGDILEEYGHRTGQAVVFGYPWVLEAYVPGIAASDPAREPRPLPSEANAVIIDPVFSKRAQLPAALRTFVDSGAPGFRKLAADRIEVYVRTTAPQP
jgi:4-amino-4-deoxy-L-arabinose transferase-like glycosyltransferase